MSLRWYVVHVFSGSEKKVAEALKDQIEHKGMGELIKEVLVPTEEVIEVKKGVRVNAERKFFPGYILVQMDLNDDTWHFVKSQPRVSGFLGSKGKPIPITEKEAQQLLNQITEGIERPRASVVYEVGEQVRVCDGPFASFNGLVEDVDEDKSRLKVAVSIFGRSTPVDLEYSQVEKV
tara:strand:+ start:118 stop:648 length:531 start_codon:yes stop_codon:yes gene_type:complete